MYSFSYLRRKLTGRQKEREKRYYLANVLGVISFLVIASFLAPFIHDLFHVLTLKIFACHYNFYFGEGWHEEFHAHIETFCNLSERESVIMLGAGIAGTFSLSLFFFFLSWTSGKNGHLPLSNFLLYPSLGFLTDSLFYFFAKKGDILSILQVLGISYLFPKVYLIGLAISSMVVIYTYFHVKTIWFDYREIKKEIKEVEEFLAKDQFRGKRKNEK